MSKLLEQINTEQRTPLVLSDYIKIKHGFAFKGEYFGLRGSHVVLTPGNFYEEGGFRRRLEKDKWYSGPVQAGYVLEKDDLVIAMTEQGEGLLGSSALIPDNDLFLHNQRIGLVQITDAQSVDKHYLYYLFNTKLSRNWISSSASGTKVRHTSPDRITSYKYSFPSLLTQKKIAGILDAYDSKIKNNNLIIKSLELVAQTIFDEWFVNFRFPGHEKTKFVDSEMGEIPEGWEVGRIKDLIRIESGFPFSSSIFDNSGKYKLVTIRNVQDGSFVTDCENYIGTLPDKLPTYCKLHSGDILLSLTGNVGRVCLVDGEGYVLNQRVSVLVPIKERDRAYTYFLFRKRDFQSILISLSKGTAQLNLSPVETRDLEAITPSEEVLEKYRKIAMPMYKKIIEINSENQKLKESRDQLLAKLI